MGTHFDAMEAEDRREEGRQAEEELNFVLWAARQEREKSDEYLSDSHPDPGADA